MVANVLPIINLPMTLGNLPIALNGLLLVPIGNDMQVTGFSRKTDDRQTNKNIQWDQIVVSLQTALYASCHGELLQHKKSINASSDQALGISQLSSKA